jgi:CelD/BcsL family acetyltransferase involved in cellulose biosynthesis
VAGHLSDYFGIVAKNGIKIDPRTLLPRARLAAMLFTHLEEGQLEFGLKGQSPECGHVIEFSDGGQSFWQQKRSADRKFVSDTERRERRLEQDLGPIRFDLQSRDPQGELQKLIAAKREQYARTQVADSLSAASSTRFLNALMASTDPLCSGVMSTFYVGETWVASHFGLQCDKTLHYWFPAYNPKLRSYGPGRLLLKRIIQLSHERGISRIDRGAGDSAAKRDFSTGMHNYYRGLWSANGLSSLPYRMGLSVIWRYQKAKARIVGGRTIHGVGQD